MCTGPGLYRQVPDVSAVGRWQLVSRWCLLKIACRPDVSKGVHKYGNHWASFCHPVWDRLRGNFWEILDNRSRAWGFSSLWVYYEPHGWQAFYNRRRREVSCYSLVKNTWQNVSSTLGHKFWCHVGTKWSGIKNAEVMCTNCHRYCTYITKTK